ncbi:MAG: hypothetical protein ACLSX5_03170 [Lachnospiraceae bacterium]
MRLKGRYDYFDYWRIANWGLQELDLELVSTAEEMTEGRFTG